MQETPVPCCFDHLLFLLPACGLLCQAGIMTYICTNRLFAAALVMPAISPSSLALFAASIDRPHLCKYDCNLNIN